MEVDQQSVVAEEVENKKGMDVKIETSKDRRARLEEWKAIKLMNVRQQVPLKDSSKVNVNNARSGANKRKLIVDKCLKKSEGPGAAKKAKHDGKQDSAKNKVVLENTTTNNQKMREKLAQWKANKKRAEEEAKLQRKTKFVAGGKFEAVDAHKLPAPPRTSFIRPSHTLPVDLKAKAPRLSMPASKFNMANASKDIKLSARLSMPSSKNFNFKKVLESQTSVKNAQIKAVNTSNQNSIQQRKRVNVSSANLQNKPANLQKKPANMQKKPTNMQTNAKQSNIQSKETNKQEKRSKIESKKVTASAKPDATLKRNGIKANPKRNEKVANTRTNTARSRTADVGTSRVTQNGSSSGAGANKQKLGKATVAKAKPVIAKKNIAVRDQKVKSGSGVKPRIEKPVKKSEIIEVTTETEEELPEKRVRTNSFTVQEGASPLVLSNSILESESPCLGSRRRSFTLQDGASPLLKKHLKIERRSLSALHRAGAESGSKRKGGILKRRTVAAFPYESLDVPKRRSASLSSLHKKAMETESKQRSVSASEPETTFSSTLESEPEDVIKKSAAQRAVSALGHQIKASGEKPKLRRSLSSLHRQRTGSVEKMRLRRSASAVQSKLVQNEGRKSTLRSSSVRTPAKFEGKNVAVVTPNVKSVRFCSPTFKSPLRVTRNTPAKTQESMRADLNEWLQAKGKTPSGFRHLMCFGAHVSAEKISKSKDTPTKTGLSVEELEEQQKHMVDDPICQNLDSELRDDVDAESEEMADKLGEMLQEVNVLFDAGCPPSSILPWLDQIKTTIPSALDTAQYWICRANVVEQFGDDNEVLNVFEEAARKNAKPPNDIASALTSFVERMTERQKAKRMAAHTPRKLNDVQKENIFKSSAVKLSLSEPTPFFKRLRGVLKDSTNSPAESPKAVVTPVRRSTRRSCASLPSMLQEHNQILSSMDDIPNDMRDSTLFHPNKALLNEFDESDEEN